ncbi:MAG TPA: serine hydrolase domain-containing protein [Acetobacteraceae bacterium]|nr:serine hydrolase domain-containing protein [Acetobacteraceae bacterium]
MSISSIIDPILRDATRSAGIPGIVGLAATGRDIIYQGAFGHLGADRPEPMRTDSVFRIASMTKAITGAAVMQLVEQGRIGLEQPAGEIADYLRDPPVLEGFDAAGKPKLRPARTPITIRHLLTHTSGFSYDLFNADVGRYMRLAGLPSIATCKNDSLRAPLIFDPGTRWEYGISIDWLGKVVQAISGKPLEDYVADHIAGPLGMKDTTFKPDAALRRRMVSAHARQPDGKVAPIEFEFPTEADFVMGGGGLVSTGPDYLRFTRMLLNRGTLDGAQVLKPETVALMRQNHIGDIDVPTLFKSDNPAMALTAELLPGVTKKWGLSFLLNVEPLPTGRGAYSMAWAGVHNTFFWIDPERDVTAVLMMQLLPANDTAVLETLVRYEIALYQAVK